MADESSIDVAQPENVAQLRLVRRWPRILKRHGVGLVNIEFTWGNDVSQVRDLLGAEFTLLHIEGYSFLSKKATNSSCRMCLSILLEKMMMSSR